MNKVPYLGWVFGDEVLNVTSFLPLESYQLLSGQHHGEAGILKSEKVKSGSGKKGSLFSNGMASNLQEVPLLGKICLFQSLRLT